MNSNDSVGRNAIPDHQAHHGEAASYLTAERQRQQLVEICRRVETVADQVGNQGSSEGAATLRERVENDAFLVMVVGDMKRGKSTFVNALLGEQVLPVKATPATAIITEVRYGEAPVALLWREGEEKPKEIHPRDLIREITIDNENPDLPSQYSRAEVIWPLPLCRNGVVLIDSPGRNENQIRDDITIDYLKKADAVVFMQHAIAPMSLSEQQFLKVYLDAYDPFFVFTYFDAIDPEERDAVIRSARKRIIDIRTEGRDKGKFFFVDGKAALRARIDGDAEAFRRSGVAALAASLEGYLVNERHKVKIRTPSHGLRTITRELAEAIPRALGLLDLDAAELARRWELAQNPLKALEAEAEQISKDLQNNHLAMQAKVETLLAGFIGSVASQAPGIAQASSLHSKLKILPWKVRESAEAVAEEIAKITAMGIEERIARWVGDSLEPVIQSELEVIAVRTDAKIASFEGGLQQLRISLGGVSDAASVGLAQEESPMTRLLAGAGGFVVGGVAGGLVGSRLGPKEMLRTLLPTLAIATAWLLTPLGIPSLIGALLLQGFTQTSIGLKRLENKMKDAIGKEIATRTRLEAPELAAEAARKFAQEALTPVEQAVSEGLTARLTELTREVESARKTRDQGTERVAKRRGELEALKGELRTAEDDLHDLIDEVA